LIGLSRQKLMVGLDIGSYAIKVVELKAVSKDNPPQFEVQKVGYEPLPHDAIVDGMIIDTPAVVETIKMVFDTHKISNKQVAISISGNSVIIKKIALPSMETEELAESIIWEAKHNIPYPYEETSVDYAMLKPTGNGEEQSTDILLVAAKKETISNYTTAVAQARKHIRAIGVDLFALHNCYEVNYPDMFSGKTVALINLGANITNVVVVEKGNPQVFRDLSLGGLLFAEEISKEMNISYAAAEKLLKGIPSENTDTEKFEMVISLNIENIISELEKVISFFEAGERENKRIEHILIGGGLSQIPNLVNKVEESFQIHTELFNPFRRMISNNDKVDSIYLEEMAPLFGVASGLATRLTS
jgi:type IV pilus assembly protein PilM